MVEILKSLLNQFCRPIGYYEAAGELETGQLPDVLYELEAGTNSNIL